MRIVPVRSTSDPAAMSGFLAALGLATAVAADSGGWIELTGSGGGVGVHAATPAESGRVELSFESDEPLEAVAARLTAAGYETAIVDETFGRSLRTRDPEGVEVQVNEAMTDLYGYSRP